MINSATVPTVRRRSLQWKVMLPFVLIGFVMTVGVSFQAFLSQGLIVHPIWEQLLSSRTEQYLALARRYADAPLPSEGPLRGWRLSGGPLPADMPAYFAQLGPGYYDEEDNDEPDFNHSVLVTAVGNERIVMAVDITALEGQQNRNAVYSSLFWLLGMIMVTFSVLRIYRSLRLQMQKLARAMNGLNPERPSERLQVEFQLVELHDIAVLVNGHLDRVERFVERERSLLDQASHEFRTPIAVVAGAVDVLMQQMLPPTAMGPLQRIRATTDNLTEIMAALLYLSREPDGKVLNESTNVDGLLEVLVADHGHLLQGKLAGYVLDDIQPTLVQAPEAMVRIVVGNLLRNAAENSYEGAIVVTLQRRCLTVRDCGIGFDIAAAARSYSASLRNSAKLGGGQGLGLFLIRRICERFGWTLSITSTISKGTLAELRF